MHKNKEKQLGTNNSQFGTCWINNGSEVKKIKKDEFPVWEQKGYSLGRTSKENKNCLHCEKLLSKRNDKFCDNKCQGLYYIKQTNEKIKSDLAVDFRRIRRYLLTLTKNCQVCGCAPIWNNKPLTMQIDHIDGNSDNNQLFNLRVICPNCHTQTETFTGRNIKNTKRNNYLRKYKKDNASLV